MAQRAQTIGHVRLAAAIKVTAHLFARTQSPIRYLYDHSTLEAGCNFFVAADEILWLDVAMTDADLVAGVHSVAHLDKHAADQSQALA